MVSAVHDKTLSMKSDVFNVKEVSKILKVSEKNVYAQVKKGSLHSIAVGREIRIPRGSLIEYLYGKDKDGKK